MAPTDVGLPAAAPADRYQLLTELPASPDRLETAMSLLQPLLAERKLPPTVAAQWLVPAHELLAGPENLDMFVQHDSVLQIVTIELWRDGQSAFGTEAWIG